MRRTHFTLSLVASFAVCCLLSCSIETLARAQTKPGPKMVVKKQSHDFKEVLEGAVIEHSFTILNQGQDTLLIEEVQPG